MRHTMFMAGVLALAATANGFVFWNNPNGTAAGFDWKDGGSDNGLFGDPTVLGNTFTFFPNGFIATGLNGTASIVSDRLEVELIAHQNFNFSGIKITELGDYGILGTGGVQTTAFMVVTDLDIVRPWETDLMVTNPAMPIMSGSGAWTGTMAVDLLSVPGPDWVHIKLVLNNNLQAFADANSSSFIQKKAAGITIEVLPTPGTLALLGFAGALAARRRR